MILDLRKIPKFLKIILFPIYLFLLTSINKENQITFLSVIWGVVFTSFIMLVFSIALLFVITPILNIFFS